jgi:AraC-like DNA-binding protein
VSKGQFLLRKSRVAGVEAVEAETDHVFSKHTHEHFGIGVIRRGAHRSLSGRGVVEALPGNVITVNPGEVHDGAPLGDQGRAWTMLYLDPAIVASAIGDIREVADCGELRHPVLADRDAAAVCCRLYRMVTAEGHREEIEAESLLLSLINRLISERDAGTEMQLASSLRHAKALMDDRPTADLKLANLARVADLSRFQVLRGLTKMTGLTPHAYLMQRRADLARRLIRQRQPLADVAAASGFADQSHMTRVFVSRYGFTPGAYAVCLG